MTLNEMKTTLIDAKEYMNKYDTSFTNAIQSLYPMADALEAAIAQIEALTAKTERQRQTLREWNNIFPNAGPAKAKAKIADLEARIQRGGGEFDVALKQVRAAFNKSDVSSPVEFAYDYLRDHITTVKPEVSTFRWVPNKLHRVQMDEGGYYCLATDEKEAATICDFHNYLADAYDEKCRELARTDHTLQHDREAARKTLTELRETIASLEAERDELKRKLKSAEDDCKDYSEAHDAEKLRADELSVSVRKLQAERDELKARLAAQTPVLPDTDDAERWAREFQKQLEVFNGQVKWGIWERFDDEGREQSIAAMAHVLALRDAERENAPVPASHPKPQNLSVADWNSIIGGECEFTNCYQAARAAKAIHAKVDDILQGAEKLEGEA